MIHGLDCLVTVVGKCFLVHEVIMISMPLGADLVQVVDMMVKILQIPLGPLGLVSIHVGES
jgi:hypothetical protein